MRKRLLLLIYLLIMGMAFAVPTRSNVAAKEIATLTVDSGFSAKDYIQDGLVAMWDGIENAGPLMHDDNAKAWVDMTGNGHNITNSSYYTSNPWVDGNARNVYHPARNSEIPFSDDEIKTVSVCCSQIAMVGNQVNIISFGGMKHILIYKPKACFICNLSQTYSPSIDVNNLNSFTLIYDWDKYNGYNRNKGWFSDTPVEDYIREYANGQKIVMIGSYGNYSGYGKIHNVRVYNRALSQEEITYNWNIDKERFGLE